MKKITMMMKIMTMKNIMMMKKIMTMMKIMMTKQKEDWHAG